MKKVSTQKRRQPNKANKRATFINSHRSQQHCVGGLFALSRELKLQKRGKLLTSSAHVIFVLLLIVFFLAVPATTAVNDNSTNTTLNLSIPQEALPGYIEILPLNETTNETTTDENQSVSEEVVGAISGPLIGEIVAEADNESNTTSFYVRLDDPVLPTELRIKFNEIIQERVILREPVHFTQEIRVTSSADEDDYIVNLWEFANDSTTEFLQVAQELQISEGDAVISTQPIFSTSFVADEPRIFTIDYTLAPVTVQQSCADYYLFEFLPEGVTIIENDLPLSTQLGTKCTIDVQKENNVVYDDVEIPVAAFIETDPGQVKTSQPARIDGNYIILEDEE